MVASEASDQYEVSPATAGTQVCLSPPPLLCSCRAQLADPSSTPHPTPQAHRMAHRWKSEVLWLRLDKQYSTSLRVLHSSPLY